MGKEKEKNETQLCMFSFSRSLDKSTAFFKELKMEPW
jgi:hypothetical protein